MEKFFFYSPPFPAKIATLIENWQHFVLASVVYNQRFIHHSRVVKKTGFENQFFQKLVFKKKKKTEKSGGEKKTDTFHQAFL